MEHQLHTKTNTHSRGYTCDWFLFTHISAAATHGFFSPSTLSPLNPRQQHKQPILHNL